MVEKKHWWESYSWRDIQTNLRQIDMKDIDAEQYSNDILDFNASIAMINVGGIIASYQTELEDHYLSHYLQGDSLEKIIDACHKKGIKVIARVDFSKIRTEIFLRHPDWAYRTKHGDIINYNGDVHACVNGGYQQEYVYKIVKEINDKLSIDGIFFNMGGFNEHDYGHKNYGICHCQNCQRKFKERFGLDLPEECTTDNPVYRKYLLFKEQIVDSENLRLKNYIKSINPEIAVDGFDFSKNESNTEYKRPLPFFQYESAEKNRMIRGINNSRYASVSDVDFVGFFYRHISVSAAEHRLRLYQSLANRGGLDYYLIGRLDNHEDQGGFNAVKEVFKFHKDHSKEYLSLKSEAKVLLIVKHCWGVVDEERGWVRALSESHIQFDEVVEAEVLNNSIDKYSTIIVPQVDRMHDTTVKKLHDFAKAGGSVIVVGQSGQWDDNYDLADTRFNDLLGIKQVDFNSDKMVSSMLKKTTMEDEIIFDSSEHTKLFMVGDNYQYAIYKDDTHELLSLIPPHWIGPPERCFYNQISSYPGIVENKVGKGKGIFIPWLPGTIYYREGYDNTLLFMKDVLLKLTNIESCGDNLSEMVEVTLSTGEDDSYSLIQFVNGSGHFGTSYFNSIPMHDLSVHFKLKKEVISAVCLTTGQSINFKQVKNEITLTLPVLTDFESIKLEYK